jgi:hypothetical protein
MFPIGWSAVPFAVVHTFYAFAPGSADTESFRFVASVDTKSCLFVAAAVAAANDSRRQLNTTGIDMDKPCMLHRVSHTRQ